jgi:hypothetical protein
LGLVLPPGQEPQKAGAEVLLPKLSSRTHFRRSLPEMEVRDLPSACSIAATSKFLHVLFLRIPTHEIIAHGASNTPSETPVQHSAVRWCATLLCHSATFSQPFLFTHLRTSLLYNSFSCTYFRKTPGIRPPPRRQNSAARGHFPSKSRALNAIQAIRVSCRTHTLFYA